MAYDLADLEARLQRAARLLEDLHAEADYGRERLKGKIEGVRLALSYVEEARRQ